MNEVQRRRVYIEDEANLQIAIDDAAEAIRFLLRALAAKDTEQPAQRAISRMRSLLSVYRDKLPAQRILVGAIGRLKNLDAAVSEDGYIVETTLPAIHYFAEATAADDRFSSANRRRALNSYRTAITEIDEVDRLRRDHGR